MSLIRILSIISLDEEFTLAVEDDAGLHPAVHDSHGKPYIGLGGCVYTQRSFQPGILQRYLYREVRKITQKTISGKDTLTIVLY